MRGLNPHIVIQDRLFKEMDCPVKPGNDDFGRVA
jgi:hypothetical protein